MFSLQIVENGTIDTSMTYGHLRSERIAQSDDSIRPSHLQIKFYFEERKKYCFAKLPNPSQSLCVTCTLRREGVACWAVIRHVLFLLVLAEEGL